jgi:phage/plasmid-associated DNA primase
VEAWNGEETSATAFYQLYRDYCVENDYEYVTSQKRFGNLMLTFIRDGLIIKQLKNTGTLYKK